MRPFGYALLLVVALCSSTICCQDDDLSESSTSSSSSSSEELTESSEEVTSTEPSTTTRRADELPNPNHSYYPPPSNDQERFRNLQDRPSPPVKHEDVDERAGNTVETTTHYDFFHFKYPRHHSTDPPRDANMDPYIRFRNSYDPYFDRYYRVANREQMYHRVYFRTTPFNPYPMQYATFAYSPNIMQQGLVRTNKEFNRVGEKGMFSGSDEDGSKESHEPEYISRLKKAYNLDRAMPSTGLFHYGYLPTSANVPQPFHLNLTSRIPILHALRAINPESDSIKQRLKQLEIERIRLHAVVRQIRGILRDMSQATASSSEESSKMNPSRLRICRIRNLYLIMLAATRMQPLNQHELGEINYSAGLFDPATPHQSRMQVINSISGILRRSHAAQAQIPLHDEPINTQRSMNEHGVYEPKATTFYRFGERRFPFRTSVPTTVQDNHLRVEKETSRELGDTILGCRLRRLRNLYIMVKSVVTGTKLNQEEVQILLNNQVGFFEPGMTDEQKAALIARMADNIRMSAIRTQLLDHHSPPQSPIASNMANIPPHIQEGPRAPHYNVFASVGDLRKTEEPKDDEDNRKMHITGKIQVDLNLDGDIDPDDEGILSKLL